MRSVLILVCLILLTACSPQQKCSGMTFDQAVVLAQSSECAQLELVTDEYFCNENSDTWWIELVPDENGCNPACVISSESVEINWRCTGLIIE